MIKYFSTFKSKLSLLVTGMVLIAAVGVGGISLLFADFQIERMIAKQELLALGGAAAYIDNDIRHKQQLLRAIAEEAQTRALGPEDIQDLLESHDSLRDEFINVASYDARGDRVASLKNRKDKIINVSKRPYFQQTMATRDSVISAPFRSALSNRPVVSITQPILDRRGNIIAILLGGIDLLRPSFADQIDALRAGEAGYLFIVTSDGTVVHHPNKALLLTRPNEEAQPVLHAVRAAPEGWRTDMVDGGSRALVAHRRLAHVDWIIAVSYPLRSAFEPMVSVRLNSFAAAGLFTVLAGLFGWALVKILLEPLDKLQHNIEAHDAGAAGIEVFDTRERDEFGMLSRAVYRLSRHRQQSAQDLERKATTDVLTGAYNRRMFEEFLPAALARSSRSGEAVAVAFLDIDHFKDINDTWGHAAGDAVLVEFARRLEGAVRLTDTVARLAGDEFVIVFEQLQAADEAHQIGPKILAAMAQPFEIDGKLLDVTASVGLAVATQHTAMEAIMHAADQALYGVKAAGRNGYAVNLVGAGKLNTVRARPLRQALP
ncbi:sensor domain-containing diguanylate cyclase [Massilia sp. ST3]|uniref:sensor domain-containing diguanylate cyclase n=1 Tax=Massilia sp. ST3 TaxID=2824903 RepID=UPI001B83E0AB|nr:sensor domain-containing diguanylate cyclase [Massilia sp. ST3]MBQ5946085.1 GGDEF domain-containing protein [Massilia sp. ST3]